MVLLLANLVLSVLVVTTALVLPSLERRVAVLLGLGGSLAANFLFWLVAPDVWTSPAAAWVCSVVGTFLAVTVWAAARVPTRRRRTS